MVSQEMIPAEGRGRSSQWDLLFSAGQWLGSKVTTCVCDREIKTEMMKLKSAPGGEAQTGV